MHVRRGTGRGLLLPTAVLAVLVLATAIGSMAASGSPAAGPPSAQGEERGKQNVDNRRGRKAPSERQRQKVKAGSEATFNKFGAPESLSDPGTYLATGLPADGVAAARAYLSANRELLGLSESQLDDLELVNAPKLGPGSAVLFRQTFGGLEAGRDGLVTVGVVDGKVAYLSSSLTTETQVTGSVALTPEAAVRAAAQAAGQPAGAISNVRSEDGWTVMDVEGYTDPARARLVAVPTPTDGVRQSYEVLLMDVPSELGAMSYVDAANGALLVRDGIVDHASDNPAWKVFPASPPLDYSSSDIRQVWCSSAAPGCQKAVANPASPQPWDVDAALGTPWFLTRGNNARATEKWNTNQGSAQGVNFASSPTRDYVYPWTNQWLEQRCNPAVFTSPQLNDIDAARANLHAMHNRMHDWSYHLGFTETNFNAQAFNFGKGGLEGDPEHGNAQAGGVVGGSPQFISRDNANQFTPPEGQVPVTNMFLWQPVPAAFYSRCVDGDYDMSVIAHEYGHLISNRMVAGPNQPLAGNQAQAMGESWSDLSAVEFLNSQALVPIADENPFAVGPYVTNDKVAGIRNYGMNASPLNYSDVGYDFACNTTPTGACPLRTQVHADGEIWSATNFDIRQAMIAKFNGSFPAGDIGLQQSCVDGSTPVTQCPGNRRWAQLYFDAWLLMATGGVSMVDARNAMLAADLLRFGGANQGLLWNAFARRGLGANAASIGTADPDPTPSFESAYADNATITFSPTGDARNQPVQLFIGRYEGAITPIADTDPATPLGDTFRIVPGEYELVARGNGFGTERLTASFDPGRERVLRVPMDENLASASNGATAAGDGVNLGALIDDTEATNWASLSGPVLGKQVTVRLAPEKAPHQIRRVQVSAMLRVNIGDANDPGGQNRFTALRQFEIWACEAKRAVDCSQDSQFERVFTSPDDAFPAVAPRPRAPELIMRTFEIPRTKATHIRLRVLTNQCTGGPAYQGDQDDDPGNTTDCDETTIPGLTGNGTRVRAAELQVFTR